ncbi:VOC family protein [Kribbella sp. NPDC004875]|uniref:VOC family protein n=1 Tax=Kribbella sp. NPDC004875 TaxID=3364107 RepID=UPI0036BDC1C9
MSVTFSALSFDAKDPAALARFWAAILGWEVVDGTELVPHDNTGFRLRFLQSDVPKDRANQMHFDLTSQVPEDQQATVARALENGGRHIDVGQKPEEGHVVLADPEGNEFCVIPAGNNFLKDTAFIGALSSDGSQAVGYFWSKALEWPLVWDQDEETAIQSPQGGPKITWGGPPVEPKAPRNRLRYELTTADDVEAEVERLIALGAKRLDAGPDGSVELADPDGNEFTLRATR